MKKILLSLGTISVTALLVGVSATGAFLSDTETAAGNTFTAGAIDLKVDNESYYNGAISEHTTFGPSDLDSGFLFLNFTDLKPDDEGEDTISLHVNNNDAYLCMDMSLTSNDDVSSNEPELDTGDPQNTDDAWDGELGSLVKMVWWVDDGDNVLEEGETLLSDGVQTILNFFGEDNAFSADLADSTTNVWTGEPGPVFGSETYYIGKAWCYGTMALFPLPQDGSGNLLSPIGSQGGGFTCDGKTLGNESQTDAVTIDIAFTAIQARHNPKFTCDDEEKPPFATITVVKEVVNDDGGNNLAGTFQLFVGSTPASNGDPIDVVPGAYEVSELGAQGYEATFGGDCDADGNITLLANNSYTCTITNDDIRPNITLIKNVVNDDGGGAVETDFKMRVNGTLVPSGGSKSVDSNTNVTITEDAFAGYTATGISGTGCPANLGDVFTLNEGVAIMCTITNDDNE